MRARSTLMASILCVLMSHPAFPSGSLPEPTYRAIPFYPDAAYRDNLNGFVVVRALIGLNGAVERAEIEKPDSLFDAAALAAARKWTFHPAMTLESQVVRVWTRVPFKFQLGNPSTDPRVLSDSLWRGPWSSTPAVMRQQREALVRRMRDADEVWLFRLDPNSDGNALPANARSRFDRRAILDATLVRDAATRATIRRMLADVRTHARPPRLKGEHMPRLGIRFVSGPDILDVAVSFADAAMFLKDGRHLWAGSAMPHWREWGQVAHAAFPEDPNFARYATADPMTP